MRRYVAMALAIGLNIGIVNSTSGETDVNAQSPCLSQQIECVNAVVYAIIRADNAGDIHSVLSYYAENAVLISPIGPDVIGKEDIQAHYSKLFAESRLRIDTEIFETIVSQDWAISRGVNTVNATSVKTNETTVVNSKFLMTLHHDHDIGWRIVHLMWNNQNVGSD